jgi:hypothetical protein
MILQQFRKLNLHHKQNDTASTTASIDTIQQKVEKQDVKEQVQNFYCTHN